MKVYSKIIISAIVISGFTRCNNDIFIEDYLPNNIETVSLSEKDNTKEITLASDNWGIDYIEGHFGEHSSIYAYDIDGNKSSLPFEEKKLGTIHCKNEYLDLKIEKSHSNKLKISFNENLFNDSIEIGILIGNNYKKNKISLKLAPTSKYNIDSVAYYWDEFFLYGHDNLEEVERFEVNNKSDYPTSVTVYPFKNTKRRIYFYPNHNNGGNWDEDMFRKYFGKNLPEITIPDVEGNKPVLENTKVHFGLGHQAIGNGLDKDLSVKVTIDAHDRRMVCVFNEMENYEIPLKVYASNPTTGRRKEFKCLLESKDFIDFLIFKENIK